MKQEMTGWQWHQLDHVQIICTSLHTDNHASTSSLNFLQALPDAIQQCQSVEVSIKALKSTLKTTVFICLVRVAKQ